MVDSAAGLSEGPDRSTGLIAWLDGTGTQSRLSTTRHQRCMTLLSLHDDTDCR